MSVELTNTSCFSGTVLEHACYRRGRLIAQCAESRVYECEFYGFPAVCKHRFEKDYRHPKLDSRLREQRTAREARALARCVLAGIRVPAVWAVHPATGEIIMELITGITVKALLDNVVKSVRTASEVGVGGSGLIGASCSTGSTEKDSASVSSSLASHLPSCSVLPPLVFQILEGIGEVVGALHQLGVVHGDLTTSNFIYAPRSRGSYNGSSFPFPELTTETVVDNNNTVSSGRGSAKNDLVVIDFGLVNEKSTAEDRAVDLYVLLRAFGATHPTLESIAEECILHGYCHSIPCALAKGTLSRLEVVRARGRKRSMVG